MFHAADRSTPLKVERLALESSSITVNQRKYVFGEIEHCTNDLKMNIENYRGGVPYFSKISDVLVAGDVRCEMPFYLEMFHQEDDSRKVEKFRRVFMEAVESETGEIDPLEHFKELGDTDSQFLIKHQELFRRLGEDEDEVDDLMNFMFQDTVRRRDDTLTILHPKAVDKMVKVYEDLEKMEKQEKNQYRRLKKEVNKLKETAENLELSEPKQEQLDTQYHQWQAIRVSVKCLKQLIFSPPRFIYYNRLTVFGLTYEDKAESSKLIYFKRIPDGVSLREGVKRFMTRMLGGRSHIRIDRLSTEHACGIICLPVGLKLAPSEYKLNADGTSLKDPFGPFGEVMDRGYLKKARLHFYAVPSCLESPIMNNLDNLHLEFFLRSPESPTNEELDKLSRLSAQSVTLDLSTKIEKYLYLFNQWIRNADPHQIGKNVKVQTYGHGLDKLISRIECNLDGVPADYLNRDCWLFPLGDRSEAVIYVEDGTMIKLEILPVGSASPFDLIPQWFF